MPTTFAENASTLSEGIASKLSSTISGLKSIPSSAQRPFTAPSGEADPQLTSPVASSATSSAGALSSPVRESGRIFDFANLSSSRPQGSQASSVVGSPRQLQGRVNAPPSSPAEERLMYPSKQQNPSLQLSPKATVTKSMIPSTLHLPNINASTSPSSSSQTSHVSPTHQSTNSSSSKPITSPTNLSSLKKDLASYEDRFVAPPMPPHSPGAVRDLMHQLDEVRHDRESADKRHRQEIEALKERLYQQQQQMLSQAQNQAQAAVKTDYSSYARRDDSQELRLERDDLQAQVRRLEQEVSRLRDEAIIRENRHRDEILYLKAKYDAESREKQQRYDDEVKQIEQRHQHSIEALKQLHHDELQAIQDRQRDKSSFEQLLGQLTSTSGSIRLIEEQLALRYHGMEAVKEGQIEARERLVKELEDQARSRMESAETESYKVKGLIMHLEHMASSMQQQLMEDKLRLRQENERCTALQTSLEQERRFHHERSSGELAMLKAKLHEAEVGQEQLNKAKLEHEEKVIADDLRLAADRKELKQLAQEQARLAASTSKQLKDDEDRMKQLRHDISIEMKDLDQKRLQIRKEMEQLDHRRQELSQQHQQLEQDKQQHQFELSRLKAVSLDHEQTMRQVDSQAKQLSQRESILQRGMDDMRDAANKLAMKQQELSNMQQLLQQQHARQAQKEEELSMKKVLKFGSDRQTLHAVAISATTVDENLPLSQSYSSRSICMERDRAPVVDDSWSYAFRSKLMMSDGARIVAQTTDSADVSYRSQQDLQLAKRTLLQSKYQLHGDQNSFSSKPILERDYQLRREDDFLSSLRQSKMLYR
jgi:hypothetical protein